LQNKVKLTWKIIKLSSSCQFFSAADLWEDSCNVHKDQLLALIIE
jgi:hypothetical protein